MISCKWSRWQLSCLPKYRAAQRRIHHPNRSEVPAQINFECGLEQQFPVRDRQSIFVYQFAAGDGRAVDEYIVRSYIIGKCRSIFETPGYTADVFLIDIGNAARIYCTVTDGCASICICRDSTCIVRVRMYLRNGVAGVYQRAGFRDRGDLSALDLGAQVHNCIAVFDCSEIVRADARGPLASSDSTLYVTGLNCSSVLCG